MINTRHLHRTRVWRQFLAHVLLVSLPLLNCLIFFLFIFLTSIFITFLSIMWWISEKFGCSYWVASWNKFIIFTNPSARAGYDTRSIFKRSLTGLNSEYSFSLTICLTKDEEPSLSYYLPIAGGRIIGFIAFPRVLVLCEMQSVSSRIWTRVAVSISYDDNHYTTGTSLINL